MVKYIFISVIVAFAIENATATRFHLINGLLCIRPEFVEKHPEINSKVECAAQCAKNELCKAFSTADGPCNLFMFDKCSKYVRDCTCTRIGQVYVKQQPGLPSGALCPADYADDFCGVKYKFFNGIRTWSSAKTAIESESGLVIMADVIDNNELAHVKQLSMKPGWIEMILGGHQLPGSAEPGGGYYWISCNIPVSNTMWGTGEPDNNGGNENTIAIYYGGNFFDAPENHPNFKGSLAECVSPF